MKFNMGKFDRIIRFALAVVIGVLYLAGIISGTAAIILGVVAAIFILTSFIGCCPAYLPFGMSTMAVTEDKKKAAIRPPLW